MMHNPQPPTLCLHDTGDDIGPSAKEYVLQVVTSVGCVNCFPSCKASTQVLKLSGPFSLPARPAIRFHLHQVGATVTVHSEVGGVLCLGNISGRYLDAVHLGATY